MELDEVNSAILFLLQQDSRRITTGEMANRVGVSASTVRNRIESLESSGVIRGYRPRIDYDAAGLQLHMLFVCRTPDLERGSLAEAAREVSGVVGIQEVLGGTDDIRIEAVGTDTDDIARVNDELCSLGLEVINSMVIKSTHVQPLDHFGERLVDDRPDDDSH